MTDYGIYRCERCGRIGRDFAFWHLFPMTPDEREDALARGATLPDPSLISEPVVMCPACKATGSAVDETGTALTPRRFLTLSLAEDDAHRAVTRALRAGLAGRRPHGGMA
jgi:hypothetical protein